METIAQNKKEQESKHFTSLQIFTSHAEPALDEYLPRKDQQFLEQKQRDEEDKLYRYLPSIYKSESEKRAPYMRHHSSEIRGLRSTKCSSETLQNLLYFMYKKTQVVFFVFHFVQFYIFTL